MCTSGTCLRSHHAFVHKILAFDVYEKKKKKKKKKHGPYDFFTSVVALIVL